MIFSQKFVCATYDKCEADVFVPSPYLRKTIRTSKGLKNACFTVCGLGFYRLFVDGKEITKGFMSPYISNPDDILDYDVYDLTEYLSPVGKHVLAFQLGNGMQNAFGGYVWKFEVADFRSSPKLAFCLECEYENGKKVDIEADETIKTHPSPLRFDDLRFGEYYDANFEIENWNGVDYDDIDWADALIAEAPHGEERECIANPIVVTDEIKNPTLLGKTKAVISFKKDGFEGYLFDFGLDAAGVCKLNIKGRKNQKIEMIFGETLVDGNLSLENISFCRDTEVGRPLYIQKDTYICKGGEESYEPSFTYHGFRYVLVTGLRKDQITDDLLTYKVMNTDLPERGGFRCSNEILNKLQNMMLVSSKANFWHIPTDCPHREKNGWTADASLSAEHILLNLDPEKNYVEWLKHVCAAMDERGALPGIIPTGGWGFEWGNGPAWDHVLVNIPYLTYKYRGNKEIVKDTLPYLLKYVKYLTTRTDERGLIAIGLGDWVAPHGIRSPLCFTDSVISIDICRKSAFLFEQFGMTENAEYCNKVADGLRNAVREHLIDFSTCTAAYEDSPYNGSQTSQAMGLAYGIFEGEERQMAFDRLLEFLKAENDHLDTGVLGTFVIFHVLAEFGYEDYAIKVITDPNKPSYGDWVARGETALCEDFWGEKGGSRNHVFLGNISAWFMKVLCGINYNPNGDDLTRLDITPKFASSLTYAEAYHICPEGRIDVSWKRHNGKICLVVKAPETCHGEIRTAFGEPLPLKSGKYIFNET